MILVVMCGLYELRPDIETLVRLVTGKRYLVSELSVGPWLDRSDPTPELTVCVTGTSTSAAVNARTGAGFLCGRRSPVGTLAISEPTSPPLNRELFADWQTVVELEWRAGLPDPRLVVDFAAAMNQLQAARPVPRWLRREHAQSARERLGPHG